MGRKSGLRCQRKSHASDSRVCACERVCARVRACACVRVQLCECVTNVIFQVGRSEGEKAEKSRRRFSSGPSHLL